MIYYAYSQSVDYSGISIYNIDTKNYPKVESKLYVFDKNGKPIHNLNKSDFAISENGTDQAILDISCPPQTNPIPLSSIITIDISGSMIGARIESAKAAARAWVELLDTSIAEVALTSFNHLSYLNQDFTKKKSEVIAKIDHLRSGGGTDYNAGFIDAPGGGLLIAERANPVNNKVMLFITDGVTDGNEAQIISMAKRLNVTVYCIILDIDAPDIIKNVCSQTGGLYWDNISTEEEAKSVFKTILQVSQGLEPCTISWKSEQCKNLRFLTISNSNSSFEESYIVPSSMFPRFDISPDNFINFGIVKSGSKKSAPIQITAKNDDIHIQSISSEGRFFPKFNSLSPPFILMKDSTYNFEIEFIPTDTLFQSEVIIIKSKSCGGNAIYVTGGYSSGSIDGRFLKINQPNGGEILISGSDTAISWRGLLPGDDVRIDYSIDSGRTWNNITEKANGLTYNWKIPNFQKSQDKCFIKLRNQKGKTGSVKYLSKHSGAITCLALNPKKFELVSGGDDGLILLWDADSGLILDTLQSGQNSIHDLAWSSDGSLIAASTGDKVIIYRYSSDNWKKVIELEIGTFFVNNLSFSPDGFYLAGGTRDGNIIIWESLNKPMISSISAFNSSITDIVWASNYPLSPYIYSVSADGRVKIINISSINDLKIDNQLSVPFSLTCLSVSAKANLLAAGGNSDEVLLYSLPDLSPLSPVKSEQSSIGGIGFSLDGKYLAFGGDGKQIELFDTLDWTRFFKFQGHTDNISTIEWTDFGSKQIIATGSFDSWVEIWSPEDIPFDQPMIQEDISDNTFQIIKPTISSDNIYFGQVELGSYSDTLITDFVRNTTEIAIKIDSVRFHSSDYTILSSKFPEICSPDATLPLGIRFKPNAQGLRNSKFTIYFHRDSATFNLIGEGISKKLSHPIKLVDFGKVTLTNSKIIKFTAAKNVGGSTLLIDSINLFEPDLVNFKILTVNGIDYFSLKSLTLQANEELELEVQFLPSFIGKTVGGIAFYYDDVNKSFLPQIQLVAEGIDYQLDFKATFAFPAIRCNLKMLDTTITLRNIGSEEITISTVKIEGDNAAEFSFDPELIGAKIPGLSSKQFKVSFNPTSFRFKSAILKFSSYIVKNQERQHNVLLTGVVDTAGLVFQESNFDFGFVPEFKESVKEIEVRNKGTLAYEWGLPVVMSDFTIEKADPKITQAGMSSILTVRFLGNSQGTYSNSFNFNDSCSNTFSFNCVAEVYPVFAQIESVNSVLYSDLICDDFEDRIIELKNSGNDTLLINLAEFSNGSNGSNSYDLIPEFTEAVVIPPDSTYELLIRFIPKLSGESIDTLKLFSNAINSENGSYNIVFMGKKLEAKIEFSDRELSFKDVPEGEARIQTILLKNIGDIPFFIDPSTVTINNFEILSVLPEYLPPNISSSISIRFAGGQDGEQFTENLILTDTCGTSYQLQLVANVIPPPSATIGIVDFCGFPNDTVKLKVFVNSIVNIDKQKLAGYQIRISIPDEYLIPVGNTPQGIVSDGIRQLEIVLPSNAIEDSIYASFNFLVDVSYSDSIKIEILEAIPIGANAIISKVNGQFIVGCGYDIGTPIAVSGNLKLYQNFPNPADEYTKIVYEIFEDDVIEIAYYNMLSNRIIPNILVQGPQKAGKHERFIDVSQLAQGIYLYSLKNKTHRIVGKMIIIR